MPRYKVDDSETMPLQSSDNRKNIMECTSNPNGAIWLKLFSNGTNPVFIKFFNFVNITASIPFSFLEMNNTTTYVQGSVT